MLDQLTSLPPIEADLSRVETATEAVAAQAGESLTVALSDAAETGATDLGSALDVATSGIGDQLAFSLGTGAEESAGQITTAIDTAVAAADGTVPLDVSGDGEITASIESAIAEADTTINLEVNAEGIEEAGLQADKAVGGFSRLSESATVASGGIALASGGAKQLRGAIGGLNAGVAVTAGVFGAAGVALISYFDQAVESQAATQRFRGSLGDLARDVEQLRSISGLNTNLSTLALTLGSDDDELRNVAASLFEFVRASGASGEAASVFTQQAIALGARALALNPSLGTLGQVTEGLSTAFARGGRFATRYNLDLNRTDIIARALNTTHKESADQLTFVEQAQAGAALAAERYGNNLDRIVARGAENAEIKQRRLNQTLSETFEDLGRPLVAPVFELIEAGIPLSEQLGRILAELGRGIIPALTATLQAVTPILGFFADIMSGLPAPVLAVAAALLLFRNRAVAATTILPSLAGAGLTASQSFARAAIGIGLFIQGLDQIDGTAKNSAVGIAQLAASGALIGSAFGQPVIGAAVGTMIGLGKALLGASESAEELRDRVRGLANELESLSERAAARTFFKQLKFDLDDLRRGAAGVPVPIIAIRRELDVLARSSPAAAQRVVDGIRSMGTTSGLTAQQVESLQRTVNDSSATFTKAAAATRAATETNTAFAQGATLTAAATQAATEASAAAYDTYIAALRANLPTISSVFDEAIRVAEEFAEREKRALDPTDVINSLAEQTQGIIDFTTNVQQLLDKGLDDLAAVVLAKGPVAGGGIAKAFIDAVPETQVAAERQLEIAAGAISGLAARIDGPLGAQLRASAFALGFGVGAETGQGIDANKDRAVQTAEAFATDIAAALDPFSSIGLDAGTALALGVEQGIASGQARAAAQAQAFADEISGQFADLWEIGSPSKLFARYGLAAAEGLALGLSDGTERFVDRAGRSMALRPINAIQDGTDPSMGRLSGGLTIRVEVHGVADPVQALAAGREAGRGIAETLGVRAAVVAAQIGT